MSNDRDQEIVTSAITDTGSGLLEFLPALGQREAIAFGDGVALPVRIKFDELPKHCLPRSSTARFTEQWQTSVGDEGFLEGSSSAGARVLGASAGDAAQNMAMFAELPWHLSGVGRRGVPPRREPAPASAGEHARREQPPQPLPPQQRSRPPAAQQPARRPRTPAAAADARLCRSPPRIAVLPRPPSARAESEPAPAL